MNVTFEKKEGKEEWMTPPSLVEALNTEFDLDPCAETNSFIQYAPMIYTKHQNGLAQVWKGRVWCNPPYGKKAGAFLKKLKEHGNGIALIFARTETKVWFDTIWNDATALLFIKGRLCFYTKEGKKGGTAGSPSVLIAYGDECAEILKKSTIEGKFIPLENKWKRQLDELHKNRAIGKNYAIKSVRTKTKPVNVSFKTKSGKKVSFKATKVNALNLQSF